MMMIYILSIGLLSVEVSLRHYDNRYDLSARVISQSQPTYMPKAGFEPEIPANERPQTLALDRAATGIRGKIRASRKYGAISRDMKSTRLTPLERIARKM